MADTLESEPMRKMFVGGVNKTTDDKEFSEYFGKFGTILDCVLIKNPGGEGHRGFGFVTYDTSDSVEEVFNSRNHELGGRTLDVKRAMPKELNDESSHAKVKKLFVRNIPDTLDVEELKSYLESRHPPEKCGSIDKIDIVKDKDTGKSKGFGFIECSSTDLVDRIVISDQKFNLGGNTLNIRKAVEKNALGGGGGGGGRGRGRGGMGGRGGGRGGGNFQQGGYGGYNNQQSYGGGYAAGGAYGAGGGGYGGYQQQQQAYGAYQGYQAQPY